VKPYFPAAPVSEHDRACADPGVPNSAAKKMNPNKVRAMFRFIPVLLLSPFFGKETAFVRATLAQDLMDFNALRLPWM
jgi:hypothetical protein